MNLITKLAYNALTKTIQAIAPGGVSVGVPSLDYVGVQKDLILTNGMGSGTLTTNRAVGFKYKAGNAWRFRFNISFSFSGVANNNIAVIQVTGLVAKSSGANYRQPISYYRNGGITNPVGFEGAHSQANTGNLLSSWVTVNSDPNGQWCFSGDIECESEPTI